MMYWHFQGVVNSTVSGVLFPLGINLGRRDAISIAFRRRGARGSAKLHNLEAVFKFNGQLLRCLPPVCQWHGPFLAYIAIGKIDKFIQGIVGWEHALGLRSLAHLTVVALDGIGRVDHLTDSRGVLKIAT